MNLFIIRHAETTYNATGRVQGKGVDSDLNEHGLQQADAFYQKFKQVTFDYLITSTLKRTAQTTKLFEGNVNHILRMQEIDEISWGILEGKKATPDQKTTYQNLLSSWGQGNYGDRIEEGESLYELAKRLENFKDFLLCLDAQNVLVCTHGTTLSVLQALLQDKPLSAMYGSKHSNTGMCLFKKKKEKFYLAIRNDVSHLTSLH